MTALGDVTYNWRKEYCDEHMDGAHVPERKDCFLCSIHVGPQSSGEQLAEAIQLMDELQDVLKKLATFRVAMAAIAPSSDVPELIDVIQTRHWTLSGISTFCG